MAISEDTAALVAAQLTVAWATRTGAGKADPSRPFDAQVIAIYERFRRAVKEVPISKT
ncbi:hypothetical protein K7W03_14310 [Sphingobium sp. PNB]|uniref:hypothetical protein n=1 Tax=Sphingobium sp. PNB TaxID=863934 RepID=UPI001CA3D2D6|nr:hypothetical protein [Sphingobium sp. PNB]MCB4860765.1 hypothetical protein [Sphingobium sp. PNB]